MTTLSETGAGRLAAGLLLTLLAGRLLKFAWQRQWLTETWIQIPIVALAELFASLRPRWQAPAAL